MAKKRVPFCCHNAHCNFPVYGACQHRGRRPWTMRAEIAHTVTFDTQVGPCIVWSRFIRCKKPCPQPTPQPALRRLASRDARHGPLISFHRAYAKAGWSLSLPSAYSCIQAQPRRFAAAAAAVMLDVSRINSEASIIMLSPASSNEVSSRWLMESSECSSSSVASSSGVSGYSRMESSESILMLSGGGSGW